MKKTLILSLLLLPLSYADTTAEATAPAAPAVDTANLPAPEEPQADAIGIFTSVNIGTQGIGMDLGYEFNRYLKLRLRGAWMEYTTSGNWSSVNVTSHLHGSNGGLLLDVHPFGGSFRISAGANISPLSVNMKGSMDLPNKVYTFGGYDYKVSDGGGWIHGKYKWRSFQPYIGIGWSSDGDGASGFYFSLDLGINIMGKGSLNVDSSSNVMQSPAGQGNWTRLEVGQLEDSILKEGKDFFDIADKLIVYPVLQIGIGYRF